MEAPIPVAAATVYAAARIARLGRKYPAGRSVPTTVDEAITAKHQTSSLRQWVSFDDLILSISDLEYGFAPENPLCTAKSTLLNTSVGQPGNSTG